MQLSLEDVEQFFRVHQSLMFFVNQRVKVIDKKIATPESYLRFPRSLGSRSIRPSSNTWT